MSTDNTTQNTQLRNEAGEVYYQVAEGFRVVEVPITNDKSDWKGLVYHRPEAETVGAAIEKYGEGEVLEMINNRLSLMAYQRAVNKTKQKFGDDDAKNAQLLESLRQTAPVIFTVDDAANLKPGERSSSTGSIIRQLGKITKEALELQSKGDLAGAMEKFKAINELQQRFSAAMAEQSRLLELQANA